MTLIAGWLHNGTVMLTADSVMKSNRPMSRIGMSGTGHHMNEFLEDGVHKILMPSDDCICAISGNAHTGIQIVKGIKERDISRFSELNNYLQSIERDSDEKKLCCILIGFLQRSDSTVGLCKANWYDGSISYGDFFLSGSGTSIETTADLSKEALEKFIAQGKMDTWQTKLQAMSTIANSLVFGYSGKEYIKINVGVGGIFFGAALDGDGARWQEPTIHLQVEHLKNRQLIKATVAVAAVSDGVLIIGNKINGRYTVGVSDMHLSSEDVKSISSDRLSFAQAKIKAIVPLMDMQVHIPNIQIFYTNSTTKELAFSFSRFSTKEIWTENNEVKFGSKLEGAIRGLL